MTCITCHRVNKSYGRVSGRIPIEEGPIYSAMYGPLDDKTLKMVIEDFNVSPNPETNPSGEKIHSDAIMKPFFTSPVLCGMCHDVNSQQGLRIETAFTEFENSPAKARGETCQDCHMGKIPGIKSGYAMEPVAHIGGVPTPPKRHTNHRFAGPDYSLIHLGLFPQSVEGPEIASFSEWLEFDYESGWGTDSFEKNIPKDYVFPKAWQDRSKRIHANDFIEDQKIVMKEVDIERIQLLKRAYRFDKFVLEKNDEEGVEFSIRIKNGTDGHNAPTGFAPERTIFVQVTVTDQEGEVIFESGDRDPNGDLRDGFSRYVHNWELEEDEYLLSLESHFLLYNIRGGRRAEILPVNYSLTSLPFIRPPTSSSLLQGKVAGNARRIVRGLPPNGTLTGTYKIEKEELTGHGPYVVNIKFISQLLPLHLIWDIQGVGFDYGLSARELAERVVDGALTLWEHDIVLDEESATLDLSPSEEQILETPHEPSNNNWIETIKEAL